MERCTVLMTSWYLLYLGVPLKLGPMGLSILEVDDDDDNDGAIYSVS